MIYHIWVTQKYIPPCTIIFCIFINKLLHVWKLKVKNIQYYILKLNEIIIFIDSEE